MRITATVIALTAVLLIAYDVYAVFRFGVEGTISLVLWHAAKRFPILPFAFGVLMGHLWWQNDESDLHSAL